MKVSDGYQIRSAQPLRRKGGSSGVSGSGFETLLESSEAGESGSAAGVSGATPVASLDGMLAMQSVSEDDVKRRAAMQEGFTMLDSLEKLRSALLMGMIPAEVIRELDQRLSRQRTMISDPKLLEILDDIELRVAVEKAKLEKAAASIGSGDPTLIG